MIKLFYFIFPIIIQYIRCYSSNLFILGEFSNNDLENNDLLKHIRTLFKRGIEQTIFDLNDPSEVLCKRVLEENYVEDNELSSISIRKFLSGSSKSKNDVGTYSKCKNKEDFETLNPDMYTSNYTYFIISKNSSNYGSYSQDDFLFGLCLNSQCDTGPLSKFLVQINEILEQFFNITKVEELNIKDMKKLFMRKFEGKEIAELIPVLFIVIQLLFVSFPSIPAKLFKCCFKNDFEIKERSSGPKSDNEKRKSNPSTFEVGDVGDISGVNKKNLYQFKSSFFLGENGEELFNLKNETTEINNESGLSYIKGIRGISLILFLFGNVFLILYENPILMIGDLGKYNFIKHSAFFPIIIFCIRNCPKILFSCSGFCLSYKMMCYLDDKLTCEYENDNPGEINRASLVMQETNNDRKLSGSLYENSIDFSTLLNEKNPSTISKKYLFTFMLGQIHKLFIYLMCVFFVRCTFKVFFHFIIFFGPLFEVFLQQIIESISFLDIIGHIFFYQDFYDLFTFSNRGHDCIVSIFSMAISEINFFIVSSILIFFCYKRKISLDYLLILIITILLIGKILMILIANDLSPFNFYFTSKFQYFFLNPFMNYSYYAVGIFFGMVNYVIQKGTSLKDAIKQEKPCLMLPIRISSCFNSSAGTFFNYFIFIIIGLLTLFFGFCLAFLFGLTLNQTGELGSVYYFLKFFALIDIEVFIILLHIFILACYLKGENTIYKFLSNKNWTIANKIYFSFILSCSPCIYFMIYQSETKIKLSFFSIFFYGLICGFMSFLLASMIHIIFELPYKKIIKLIFKIKAEKRKRRNSEFGGSESGIALENKFE